MSSRWHDTLASFDLETTGVDVETARIVTACIVVLDQGGAVLERYDWLADPGVEIPAGAAAIHGVTTERARAEGRDAGAVVLEIVTTIREMFARGLALVVYNAPYDLTLLNREAVRHGVEPLRDTGPVIDPLVIDKAVDTYRRGKRTLSVAAEHYGVRLDDAHDAGADAIAAGRVAQAIVGRYADQLDIPVLDLHDRQVDWSRVQAESFQDYMRRTRDPAFTTSGAWPERHLGS
jgi:DNA polymerase-3 subunit epsilon